MTRFFIVFLILWTICVLVTPKELPEYKIGIVNAEGNETIPLKSLDYSIHAIDGLISICLTQIYKNTYPHAIDAKYVFPINYYASTNNVTVHYSHDDSLLVARLEGKVKAQEQYKESVDKGMGALHMSFDNKQRDMLVLSLGNVLPEETLEVKISFVEKLRVEDLSWAIRIPTTFVPPYTTGNTVSESSQSSVIKDKAYTMKLNLEIDSSSLITRLVSPSHDIVTKFDRNHKKAWVSLRSETDFPDRDIIILYRNAGISKPQLILQKSEQYDTYAALLSYLPFSRVSFKKDEFDTAKDVKYYNSSKYLEKWSEFIFLIDCSGSMHGRIDQARRAALLFIKSLPENSYFSFVFFGSDYKVAQPGVSVKYTKETVADALKYISAIQADMGGTELNEAMKYVLSMPSIEDYTRNILVMTDGEVSNPDLTIDLVKKNRGSAFVHTIGIGAGASRHLVQGLANAGRGSSYFITEDENIADKVIEALNDICVDRIHDVKVQWPSQTEIAYAQEVGFYGQSLTAAAIFKNKPKGKFIISGYENDNKKHFEETFDMSQLECIEGTDIYQLAVKLAFVNNEIKDREEIYSLSMKYSVLSDETAFVATKTYPDTVDRTQVKEVRIPILEAAEMHSDGMLYMAKGNRARTNTLYMSKSAQPVADNSAYATMEKEEAKDLILFDKEDDLSNLLNLQAIDGSFDSDDKIIKKFLGSTLNDIKNSLPSNDILKSNERALSTVIMLAILEKNFPNDNGLSLIKIKATNWLNAKGIDYDKVKTKIQQTNLIKNDL